MEYVKKNIILVPIDFTDMVEYAIGHAVGIAQSLNYEIILLHVINKETKSQVKKGSLSLDDVNQKLALIANDIVQNHKIKTSYIAREGSIFTTISDVTKEIGANMVIMATHGKVGVQKVVGSYAFKIIVASPAPVLVIQKRSFESGYENILIPLDDSSESKQKIKWAIYIAKKFKSTVHLLAIKETDDYLKRKIIYNLKQVKTILSQNNIECTDKTADKVSGFTKQVNDYAASIKADMIMIMTNPDQLLPSFILTPNDEKIIYNENKIPVLCINPVDLNIIVGGM